eukprot:10606368-Lingulodinium_polyedra.AAC.1
MPASISSVRSRGGLFMTKTTEVLWACRWQSVSWKIVARADIALASKQLARQFNDPTENDVY